CLGVLILGAVALDPDGPFLSSFQGCVAKRAAFLEEMGRQEQLDQRKAAIHRREEAKGHMAAEVIAGRCSLAEAMEGFHALDEEWPPDHLGPRTPKDFGMSEDEWHGRGVLYYVRLVLADRPDEAAAVVSRLEKELQELLADRMKRPPAPAA